jgi:class 3 adenylate cyclase/tetratricopeptide (TPR) repeat protein
MERQSERRLVTCVFIDVVGSTALGQRLGPERMQRVLSESFAKISSFALSEGGTIEKYIGDEVFVLFGAPAAHSDDVVRALRLADAAVHWASTPGSPIEVRIGIETGEALIDLDAVEQRQRMAVGGCVTTAARLMTHAEPNTVVVGPVSQAAAARVATFDDLGELQLKGLGKTAAFRLTGLSPSRERDLPLIGRETEVESLRSAFAESREGHPKLVLLIGPPGIGKTRILEEFGRSIASEATVLEARCRPGTEVGSSPLRDLLRGADLERLPAAVAHSAGVRTDPRLMALGALDRRTEMQSAWIEYIGSLAARKPVVICIEDLHWAEGEVVRLLDRLVTGSQTPLMVIGTARPEFPGMPLLRPSDDRLTLELPPLSPRAAAALARAAAGRDVDIARAEGHPLFIVELVRSRGAPDTTVPVTVQQAIGARLDELEPAERELLQSAAVIGETFDVQGAALLSQHDPSVVAGSLARLSHLRYLRPVDGTFRFNHALVHDIAYGRLPMDRRLRLHAQYAQEGVPASNAEALAHHWWEALGSPDAEWVWPNEAEREPMRVEAVRAHLAAGRGLGDRLAYDRMVETFERALSLTKDPVERAQIEEAFGLACARNAKGDEATEHRLRAIELYREAGTLPPVSLYADTLDLPVFNWGYFQHVRTFKEIAGLIDEGIANARQRSDQASLLRLLVQRAVFSNNGDALPEISRLLESGADLSTRADALWRLALVHFTVTEDLDQAFVAIDRAFNLATAGAPFNLPEALLWRSEAYFHAGDLARAGADADRLLEVSRSMSPHTRQHAMGTKARVLLGGGDWRGVIEQAHALRSLVREYPDDSYCIVGASLIAYGAMAELIEGMPVSEDLEPLILRIVPESPAIRAATLLMPLAMSSRAVAEDDAHRAYSRETPISDREQIWDLVELHWAIAYVVRAQWKELEPLVTRLDARATHGAKFAGALAAALREEMAAARGGAKPKHEALRGLGYNGISQLVSYRVH